ncbi:mycothiol synthase [Amycolatopsis benzoatilytica]|uniref:mycothiol synthase n=1 Tax=Amycolatopsis benzoatilytica TaxID=346045 RepID=UPI0003660223|nr:mycothiol synthase [Amycolatopsis benzoatilytica]
MAIDLSGWTATPDDAAVRAVLLAAKAANGRPEADSTGPLPREFDGGLHLVARLDGEPAGYVHLDVEGDSHGHQVAELIVHPAFRRRGLGTALARALAERAEDGFRVWAHGDHPGAAAIAASLGFAPVRELLVLHTPVRNWPEPVFPADVTLRTFTPGQDEQAVIEVNARAFDWHPEQGSLTVGELRETESADWFDPSGFFLAERDGQVVGFHWTKVHQAVEGAFGGDPAGEVYVVGVDPRAQGGGLGKALTTAGLRHLADAGVPQVILYVESDNGPAVTVYEKLGFTRYDADVQYARQRGEGT